LDGTAYPGNSGSPLYDPKSGRVIGIINMVIVKEGRENVLAKPSGIAFAIPINYLTQLLANQDN
jgi:S1-C subfamily serine protease